MVQPGMAQGMIPPTRADRQPIKVAALLLYAEVGTEGGVMKAGFDSSRFHRVHVNRKQFARCRELTGLNGAHEDLPEEPPEDLLHDGPPRGRSERRRRPACSTGHSPSLVGVRIAAP